MSGIKKYLIGLFIGLVLGSWMGVNIGKGQPLWANPFAEKDIAEKVKNKARNMSEDAKTKAGEMVKDAKKAVREKLEE